MVRAHRESSMSKLDYDAKRVANIYMELLAEAVQARLLVHYNDGHLLLSEVPVIGQIGVVLVKEDVVQFVIYENTS